MATNSTAVTLKENSLRPAKAGTLYLPRGSPVRRAVKTAAKTNMAVQSLLWKTYAVSPNQNPDSLGGQQ